MKYVFKLFFLLFVTAEMVIHDQTSLELVILLLVITASNIFREKYYNSIYIVVLEAAVTVWAMSINPYMGALHGISAYELSYKKAFVVLAGVCAAGLYFLLGEGLIFYLLMIGLSSLLGYNAYQAAAKEDLFKSVYDKERQYRYELEEAKSKLMASSREMVHLAEIKERNRIARDIHDHVGHGVAGTLMQLQAAFKLHAREPERAMELLQKSIDSLSNTLTLLRDTVYNIKPRENLGIEYLQRLIEGFGFCPIDFKHSGDFNHLSPEQMEILGSNIKEALTNASKYSEASHMEIAIDVNERFIRLLIRDNGVGCPRIKEGLGISGMRERVRNMGGSVSISSEQGFLIVCVIPRVQEGGGLFEGACGG